MGSQTKFTVIIPTRERADTLYHCLNTVVAQTYPRLDIVVSDNFSQDNTKDIVASFDDPRITYINTGERVSMSHNWEFALSHVKDGWVTILGDDDGLLPGALDRLNDLILQTNARAVSSELCRYSWPSCGFRTDKLLLPTKRGYERRKSKKWLQKLLGGSVFYPELPMIYTGGFVDISVVNAARDSDGIFFKSLTPDVYSAIAIASVVPDYVYSREPYSLAGLSGHSNGASVLGYVDDKKASKLYFSENNLPFHPELGSGGTKSVPLLVYESYLQSMHLHHDELKIEIGDQLALSIARAPRDKQPEVISYCEEVARQNKIAFSTVAEAVKKKRSWIKLARVLPLLKSHFQVIELNAKVFGVKNIDSAATLASAFYLRKRQFNFLMLKRLMYLPNRIAEYLKR